MANRLQFKRGNGAPGAILRAGEPAFDTTNNLLYVGLSSNTSGSDSNTGQVIGGLSYVERVDDVLLGDGNIGVNGSAVINNLEVTGVATFASIDFEGTGSLEGLTSLSVDDLSVAGVVTATGGDFQTLDVALTSSLNGDVTLGAGLQFGAGQRVTEISTATDLGGPGAASDEVLPTQAAVRGAIDAVVLGQVGALTLDIGSDNGDGAVGLGSTSSDKLTVRGTDNQIQTEIVTGIGQTIVVSLTDDVSIVNNLNVGGGIEVDGGIQVGGAVTFSGDFEYTGDNLNVTNDINVGGIATVGEDLIVERNLSVAGLTTLTGDVQINGDLTVSGAATQINFEVRDVAIEDRLLELGTEGGAAPSSATSWDLGLALNYNDGSAKKAAVVWQNNLGFNLASDITETTDATDSADPQITVGGFAALGVDGLHIGDVIQGNTTAVINNSKQASLNEVFIGDVIGTAGHKFASFNSGTNLIDIENSSFDGGSY